MAETKVSTAEREPETPATEAEGPADARSGTCSRGRGRHPARSGCSSALAVIWIIFPIITPGHTFLTPRNLWNLSVQTAVVAIMATGMVLIIVTRNIDLSVGAVMAAVGMAMAIVQHDWLPKWIGFDHPLTWVIAVAVGLVLGAAIGAFQGTIVAYVGVPSFIVTLGGFLVWRGVAWWMASGQTIAPMDTLFRKLGGGSTGTLGGTWSWILGIAACVGVVAAAVHQAAPARPVRVPAAPDVGGGHASSSSCAGRDPRVGRVPEPLLPAAGAGAHRPARPGRTSRSAWPTRCSSRSASAS